MDIPNAPSPPVPISKLAAGATAVSRYGIEIANINRRLRLIEERFDTMREHLEMIEAGSLDKHKSSTSDIRGVQTNIKDMRTQFRELQDMFSRLMKKMEVFASKDNLKVLERYINLWSPMKYVTRKEVQDMIKEASNK